MAINLIPDEAFQAGRIVVTARGTTRDGIAGMRIVKSTAQRVYVDECVFGQKPFYIPGDGGWRRNSRGPYIQKEDVIAVVDTQAQFDMVEKAIQRHRREVAEAKAERNRRTTDSYARLASEIDQVGVPHNYDRS